MQATLPAARAATGAITGLVFQDFDSDGTYDSTSTFGQAQDTPLADVSVRAFDATGSRVGTTRTMANGTYFLDLADSGVTEVRIEFVWPTTDPFTTMRPSFIGPDNGGSIQFVSVGATNVNFALNTPGEYCQSNPNICVTRQIWMNNTTSAPVSPSIYVSNYNSGPLNGNSNSLAWYNDWTKTKAAQFNLTGAVHGTAWDAVSRKIYTSAYVRRGVAIYESPTGTPRPAAIFVTTPTGVTAAAGAGGTTSFLVDLETLMAGDQFSNLTAPASGVANAGFTGYIPSNLDRGVSLTAVVNSAKTDSDIPVGQNGVYEEVGRAGIGDIDTDDFGNLWVVSLYTRELYKVTLKPDGTAPTVMSSAGSIVSGMTCSNGVARPHGLTEWRGDLYVGVVCDGSTGYDNTKPNDVNHTKNLTFTVRKYDTGTGTWSTFFGPQNLFVLDGAGAVQPFKGAPSGATNTTSDKNVWNPWTTLYSASWGPGVAHPIPIFSDIEFDRDGSMILGFRDMMKDVLVNNGWTSPSGGSEQNLVAPGDIYRVCRTGSGYTPADYVFEGGPGCAERSTNQTTNTFDDEYYDDNYGPANAGHIDISSGMTEQVPGFPEVLLTAFDPFDTTTTNSVTWSSGGVKYFSNTTGAAIAIPGHPAPTNGLASGVIYVSSPDGGLATNAGSFAKSNAMSDIEALCDQAPLQIGNRVWNDLDGDGIQDPGEDPIAGASVRLYDSSGTLVGTSVTDANGNYYFNSSTTEAATGNGDAVGGGLTATDAYTLKMDNPADYAPGGPLESFDASLANATTTEPTDTEDAIDSDASLTGSGTNLGVDAFPTISVPAQGPGNNNQTFDFGFAPPPTKVSVGGTASVDTDKDGVLEPGEPALPGVTMTLTDMSGNPVTDVYGNVVAPVTTDASGNYVFENLPPGQYKVTPTLPEGYTLTDPALGYATSQVLTVDGQSDTTLDFLAIQPAVSVGDLVWNDLDRDGVQDAGEPGLAGVPVSITKADGSAVTDIFGDPVTSTVTDGSGNYVFENLPPGQYKVSVATPTGFAPTVTGAGTPTTDSASGTATSENLTTDGASDTSLDFGFVATRVSVGDFVWADTDRDGIQDAGEPGIAGVTLSITNADGTAVTDIFGDPVTSTVTDSNGRYVFDNLPPGQYTVTATTPDGYVATLPAVGGDTTDSSSGSATSANLTANDSSDTSLDFGFVLPTVSVGDLVWRDTDRDGIQDAGEPGIAGVTLSITYADGSPVTDVFGNPVTTTTTDADGRYTFANLPVGQYTVTVTPPTGYIATVPGVGGGTIDSSTGTATSVDLTTGGAADNTLDFGFVRPAVSVGDYVWFDTNHDGDQDTGEPPLSGVVLTITTADGSPVTDVYGRPVISTVTDTDGHYSFDDLPPGQYVVTAATPAGYTATVSSGGTGTDDSSTGTATSVSLTTDGQRDPTLDFGFWAQPATVGSTVWVDANGNGIQDAGEQGLAGVTLTLTDSSGNPVTDVDGNVVGPTVTDAQGGFVFTNLPFGEAYTVTVTYPAGYLPTTAGAGSDPTVDSSTDSASTQLMSVSNAVDLSLDFGVVPVVSSDPTVSVGDLVWRDTDGDGVQDADEPGIPGVTLSITKADGSPVTDVFGNPVTTTTTDADGHYVFDNLPPGQYSVTVTPPTGYVATLAGVGDGTTDSSTGTATSGNLTTDGASDGSLDFGFVLPKVSVGDFVWVDTDRDGVQDVGEQGIPGVTLSITKADGSPVTDVFGNPVTTTVTDSSGNYVFDNLPPGQYTVTVIPPTGYVATLAGVGDGTTDSSTGTATSGNLTTDGASDTSLDFGFVLPKVSVGNFVWADTDRDGVQDAGEPGIPGVTLSITKADGSPVTDVFGNPVTTTTSDADGHYVFENLPPGQYTVTVIPPDGYVATLAGVGGGTIDSSTDTVTSVNLSTNGAADNTLDFGFVEPAVSVGDFVWFDSDRDGIQDVGEPGIAGVSLSITKADGSPVTDVFGNPVTTTTTDADGHYVFENLPPGQYAVTVTAPVGYVATLPGTSGSTTDSSTDTTTSSDLIVNGSSDNTLDFGFVEPAVSVGDFVWFDSDRDGIQDVGEPGIAGVTLSITKADGSPVTDVFGNPVTTTTTDADGHYVFENLPPGQYTVTVTAPVGYVATLPGVGGGTTDSSTGTATSSTLTTHGDSDTSLDFGFVLPKVSVGNFVWADTDRDGVQDAGEPGIPGVTLSITKADGSPVTDVFGNPVTTTTTDADGHYVFENLPPGQYTVTVTPPDGYVATLAGVGGGTIDSSTGTATSVNLTVNGAADNTLDFGFVEPAVSVGDFVWFDSDRDGIQDAGEQGIAGVTLSITKADGSPVTDVFGNPVTTTVTDSDGRYSFDLLPLGQYIVTVTAPDGYEETLSNVGGGTTDSSDGAATSANLTVNGERDPTLDFGFVRPTVSVGDLVWRDTDRDGIQDSGEPGIAGVTLSITNADGSPVTDVFGNPVASTVTGADGRYSFDNLPVGQYRVTVTPPPGYTATTAGVGIGDQDSSTGSATSRNMTTDGDRDPTLDFGFVPAVLERVSVGDRVWRDFNGDGYQSRIDTGVPGVTLRIFDAAGNPARDIYGNLVPPEVTNKRGKYSFDDLPPGKYMVKIVYPKGFRPTTADRPNRATNSSSHSARTVALANGQRDATLDFGIVSAKPWRPGLARTR